MVDAAKTSRETTKAFTSGAVKRSEPPRTNARSHAARAEASGGTASRSGRGQSGSSAAEAAIPSILDFLAYQRDVLERSILFFDTLRRRANNMLDHERAGLPPLLNFKYETLLDAREFERPANYALLRITEDGDDCWDDCVDLTKPPVIVIDPRAGHGPGIGGFKRDSEVGIALHTGHPVYYVVFFPEPCKGQTLGDVIKALGRFVADVQGRHDGKAPVLYGNCQGGWATALVAADCEGHVGAAVLNGSPLSYWAGEPGINPMRIMGGFVGGVWLNHFLADLNQDRFDGAWLVQNFETLKPGNALFEKYANLFTKIDTEAERFLDFERWWGGFYRLSGEEIVSIVENLFIGNRLEEGKVTLDEHCTVDLHSIKNPLVVFASYGDNITPPHQALGWIPAVYKSTDELKATGQRIVYLTNPQIGHLGIFVSASVARFEHRAILENLPEIERLRPGLYEMKIDNPTGDPDCERNQYSVRFEPRKIEDIQFEYPAKAFERVRQLSEFNEHFYRTFVSPWVRAMSNPWTAHGQQWLHPMRTSRYLFSETFLPWMGPFAILANAVSGNRKALTDDNPLLAQERRLIAQIAAFWESARRIRDAAQERTFTRLYGE
jgi:pimeloyl-ACP methyl ester carboxylesterase